MATGLIICFVIAAISTFLASLQHYIGAPMIGLILGVLVANLWKNSARAQKGTKFASGRLLKAGIVLAGGTLSFTKIIDTGAQSLPIVIFNILLAFGVAIALGKLMRTSTNTGILVGGGTAICGGTAIATLASIIRAKEQELAYAMAAIFVFDVLAAIVWPYAAMGMGLSPDQYGVLSGLAINDTSSVVAAGVTYDALSQGAVGASDMTGGSLAVVVKLTRTTMLVLVAAAAVLWAVRQARKSGEASLPVGKQIARAFPYFVLGFLALAVINTLGWIPGFLAGYISFGYKFLITMALAGVGFKIRVREIFREGAKPMLLGGCTFAAVAASTLAYVLLFL